MKKFLSACLSCLLAVALLVGCLPTSMVKAADGATAHIAFADRSWNYSNWGEDFSATQINGTGHYSLTLNAADVKGEATEGVKGAMVLCVDIAGYSKALKAEGKEAKVFGLKVLCDGKAIEVDGSKAQVGDIEENGNVRIEIYNEYGKTKDNSPLKDVEGFTFAETLTIEFDLVVCDEGSATAFLMYTDDSWGYGNWNSQLVAATTQVKGSGNYSVTLNAADVKGEATEPAKGAMVFCVDILGYTAQLEKEGYTVEVKNVEVIADGKAIAVDAAKVVTGDIEDNGNLRIELYNEYGATKESAPIDKSTLTFSDTLTVNFTLDVKDPEFETYMAFADRNWAYGNWDAGHASTVVSGAGKYSVTLNAADVKGEATAPVTGAQVFCVDVVGGAEALAKRNLEYQLKSIEVLADGQAIALDATKVKFGDLEDKGNFRIEVFNEYGATKDDSPIGNPEAFTFAETLTVNFELDVVIPYEVPTNATIIFTDRNWAYGNWDATEANSIKVLGNGTYTVTLNAADVKGEATAPVTGAQVFCVDVIGLADLQIDPELLGAKDIKVLADGKEIALDATKVKVGDIEDKGNLRIEIYNEYGDTKDASPIGDPAAFTFADKLEVTFTLTGVNYGKAPEPEVIEREPVEYTGSYFAGIGIQSNPNYIFRNTYSDATYGLLTNPDFFNEGLHAIDSTGAAVKYDGTFEDVMIDGDGTYTVKLLGANLEGETGYHMIFVTTALPYSDQLKFTEIIVKINGKEVGYFPDGEKLFKSDNTEYFDVMVQNDYNSAQTDMISIPENVKDIEITFTIEGMGYESEVTKGQDPDPTPTVAPTKAPEATATPAPTAPAEGGNDKGSNTGLIIGIIAAVVVLGGGATAGVLVSKKKK